MINDKEGEIESTPSGKFDARIVQTVRHLKQIPSQLTKVSSNSKDKGSSEDSTSREKQDNFGNIKNFSNQENELYYAGSEEKKNLSNENIIRSINNLKEKKNGGGNTMRISIDGSGQSTSESNGKPNVSKELKNKPDKEISTSNLNSAKTKKDSELILPNQNTISTNNTAKYKLKRESAIGNTNNNGARSFKMASGPFAPMKTKTEFQKRLMSEANIQKYKSTCVSLIKDDDELKKMCELCNLLPSGGSNMFSSKDSILDNFMEENFFKDNFFLYKLETLLASDVSKAKKEKFFKEEIKKFFEIKILDVQYENKIKSLNFAIDNHLKNLHDFQFFS